jgi:hypothetical protein
VVVPEEELVHVNVAEAYFDFDGLRLLLWGARQCAVAVIVVVIIVVIVILLLPC